MQIRQAWDISTNVPHVQQIYIGQTGSPFKIRFHEHFRDFKQGNRKSSFAQHLLENGHSVGTMEDIMETVQITNKGQMMDTLERFNIFLETKTNNQINDRMTVKSNLIFDTTAHNDPYRGLPNTYSS
jgi:phosphopentomutase